MTPEQRRKIDLTMARFVEAMTAWNWSGKTIASYQQNLRYFINWLHAETDTGTLADVSPDTPARRCSSGFLTALCRRSRSCSR